MENEQQFTIKETSESAESVNLNEPLSAILDRISEKPTGVKIIRNVDNASETFFVAEFPDGTEVRYDYNEDEETYVSEKNGKFKSFQIFFRSFLVYKADWFKYTYKS